MIFKLIPIFIFICNVNSREFQHFHRKRYENFTLFRGIPFVNRHMKFLHDMIRKYHVTYWREPSVLRMPVDFVISPIDKSQFEDEAYDIGLRFMELIPDIQKSIDSQRVQQYVDSQIETYDWNNFFTLESINSWMRDWANKRPEEVTLKSIGKTWEQRDIFALTINLKGSMHRSKVFIEGGIHAREWISPAFVTYMIDQILNSDVIEDEKLQVIARTYEWIFVPVLNPDGYYYSQKVERFWKKNRRGTGVDLNRNFEYMFGRWAKPTELSSVSNVPHSNNYIGEEPFSEQETRALSNFIDESRWGMEYYLSFRSYNKRIIIPYEHSPDNLGNYDEVYTLAKKAARVMKLFNNNNHYTVGNYFELYGECVSGTSTSWAKNSFNIPYTLTFELQDVNYGFLLPPELIKPTCQEVFAGVMSLLQPKNNSFTTIAPEMTINIRKTKKKKTDDKLQSELKSAIGKNSDALEDDTNNSAQKSVAFFKSFYFCLLLYIKYL